MAKDNVDEKVVKPVEARATAKVSQDTAMGRALLWFLILSGLATVLWLISVLTSSIISNLAAFETLSGRSAMLARVRQRESLTAFGSWAQRTCSADKPWLRETLLCQAVESTDVTSGRPDNWLVRRLLMLKVAQRDVDCETLSRQGHGKGLRWLAENEDSPLNRIELFVTAEEKAKRLLYGTPLPLWKRAVSFGATKALAAAKAVLGQNENFQLQQLLHRIADGEVPLSALDEALEKLGPGRRQLLRLAGHGLSKWGLALAKEDPKDKLKELRRQQKRGRVPSTAPDGCVPSQMEVPEDDDQEDEGLWAGPL